MRSLVAILALIALSLPLGAGAQFGTETLTISVSPQYPRPYDTVIVTPRSSQVNLAASRVTITANGAVIEEGSGERSAAVTLGGPGSATTIRVTAVSAGVTYSAETTIRPADVALIIEPQTSTHPIYKGSPLIAPQGAVRLVAMADFRSSSGVRVSPSSLYYTWRLGNRILTEESGIGRSTLTASAPERYRDADVSVTVATVDESMVGYAETTVSSVSPVSYAYPTDPLLGIDLAHAIFGSLALRGQEASYEVVPFHFGTTPRITWTLNGNSAGSNTALTVRAEGETSGRAQVTYTAEGRAGETANGGFTLNFGTRSSGILGF